MLSHQVHNLIFCFSSDQKVTIPSRIPATHLFVFFSRHNPPFYLVLIEFIRSLRKNLNKFNPLAQFTNQASNFKHSSPSLCLLDEKNLNLVLDFEVQGDIEIGDLAWDCRALCVGIGGQNSKKPNYLDWLFVPLQTCLHPKKLYTLLPFSLSRETGNACFKVTIEIIGFTSTRFPVER